MMPAVSRADAIAPKFGPLAHFGDDDLSLTLNALFDKTFGKYRTPATGLDYAAQFKFAVADGISAEAELSGSDETTSRTIVSLGRSLFVGGYRYFQITGVQMLA